MEAKSVPVSACVGRPPIDLAVGEPTALLLWSGGSAGGVAAGVGVVDLGVGDAAMGWRLVSSPHHPLGSGAPRGNGQNAETRQTPPNLTDMMWSPTPR